MDKFEKKFFNTLISKVGFYIRNFYSESLKKEQWIAILENEKVRFKAKEKGIENDLFEKKLGIKQKKNTSTSTI